MAILGIDEVGRGPWAGPLVIGACILPEPHPDWTNTLTDSKKLTTHKREELSELILSYANPSAGSNSVAIATGWVSATEIDKLGLSQALRLATRRAVQNLKKDFPKVKFSEIIIDGTINFLKDTPLANRVTVLKKADLLIKEVSAASIVAKVARDKFMMELGNKYPGYGFEKHMGYGTAAHRAALAKLGPCPEHRMSFKPVPKKANSTTSKGNYAETVVADYLSGQGHRLIAHNHKTKFYEIDIISTKGNQIFFTEVKYRKTATHGSPLTAITLKKQQQMRFAVEAFLKYASQKPALKSLTNLQPTLAAASVSGPDFHMDEWFEITDF